MQSYFSFPQSNPILTFPNSTQPYFFIQYNPNPTVLTNKIPFFFPQSNLILTFPNSTQPYLFIQFQSLSHTISLIFYSHSNNHTHFIPTKPNHNPPLTYPNPTQSSSL